MADNQQRIEEAFERIEEAILPSISMMLDALLDAASLAQPGRDAEAFADELRVMAHQLEALTAETEAISQAQAQTYRAASAA